MDYRKAWDEVKTLLEDAVQEGRDNGYDTGDETYHTGMYDAFKRILDNVVELESVIGSGEIEVGDTVRVANSGWLYPSYRDWILQNVTNPFFSARWARDRRLTQDATGVVRYVAPHGTQDRTLAYIEIDNVCFIVALEGLEKV